MTNLDLDTADDVLDLGNWEIPTWLQMNLTHTLKVVIVAGETPANPSELYVWWKA